MPTHTTMQPRAQQPTSRLRAGFSSLLQYKSSLFNTNHRGHAKIEWSKHAGQWRLSRRFTSSAAVPDGAPRAADPSPSPDTNADAGVGDGPSREPLLTSDTTADIEGQIMFPKPPGNIQWSKRAGQWHLTQRVSVLDASLSPAIQEIPPKEAAAPEPKVRDGQPKQPNRTPDDNEDPSPVVREGCVRDVDPKGSFNISADDGPAIREGIWKTIVRSLGFSTEDVSPDVREGALRAVNRSLGDSADEGPGVREGAWRQRYMSPGRDVEVSEAIRAAAGTLSNSEDEGHGFLIGTFGTDSSEELTAAEPQCNIS